MIEQLFELITMDKLIFFFKELSLSLHQTNAQLSAQKFLVEKDKNNFLKISDSEILKELLPNEISEKMFREGQMTLLAFVFALRHKVTLLNSLFHYSSMKFNQVEKKFVTLYEESFKDNLSLLYNECEALLQPDFWGQSLELPILGFSAVGCLFSFQKVNLCRAFDHYDILSCQKKSELIFCLNHKTENFWTNDFSTNASTQAKMFRFYLDKNNFKEFDEDKIQKLLNNFFYKYTNYKKQSYRSTNINTLEKTNSLLLFYRYSSMEELKQSGHDELRKRFLEKAKHLHPDVGGSQDLFREARTHYETLREFL